MSHAEKMQLVHVYLKIAQNNAKYPEKSSGDPFMATADLTGRSRSTIGNVVKEFTDRIHSGLSGFSSKSSPGRGNR